MYIEQNLQLYEFTLEEFKKAGLKILEDTDNLYESEYIKENIATEYEEKFIKLGYKIHYLKARNIK